MDTVANQDYQDGLELLDIVAILVYLVGLANQVLVDIVANLDILVIAVAE